VNPNHKRVTRPRSPGTDRKRLIDNLLGDRGPLDRFVREGRAEGRSWRLLARDLYDMTGADVTHETLRSWFPGEVAA
jgi:hypothetical protein